MEITGNPPQGAAMRRHNTLPDRYNLNGLSREKVRIADKRFFAAIEKLIPALEEASCSTS
jgi:hypothetical protein